MVTLQPLITRNVWRCTCTFSNHVYSFIFCTLVCMFHCVRKFCTAVEFACYYRYILWFSPSFSLWNTPHQRTRTCDKRFIPLQQKHRPWAKITSPRHRKLILSDETGLLTSRWLDGWRVDQLLVQSDLAFDNVRQVAHHQNVLRITKRSDWRVNRFVRRRGTQAKPWRYYVNSVVEHCVELILLHVRNSADQVH